MGKKGKKQVFSEPILPTLKRIKPVTIHQNDAFKAFHSKYNICLHGFAGTGKTYTSLYLALQHVLSNDSKYSKVVIIRSVVPTREIGFLPGNVKEKIEIYESPYRDICSELFDDPYAYSILKGCKKIEFQTTSHLRGSTFKDAIIIVDEIQNLSYHELSTTITRAGENCLYMYCGDTAQSDLHYRERDGVKDFLKILRNMPSFHCIEFGMNDIVRGPLVKEFLEEENAYFSTSSTR